MAREFTKASELDEKVLIKHNIATAASIVAAVRGVKPEDSGVNTAMAEILHEVKNGYSWVLWSLERHQPSIEEDVVKHFASGVWRSKQDDQN